VGHPPTIFEILAFPIGMQTLVAAIGIVLLLALIVRRELAAAGDSVIPPEGLTVRNFVEIMLDAIVNLMRENIGPEWPKFLPLIGTLGFFILISNLMGLVPGLGGPTSYIETNLAWAVMAFGVSEFLAIRHQGVAYIKHLAGPIWWLWPLMFVVEVVSHMSRLLSLTVRLTGNMFADHTLVAIFLSFPTVIALLVPWAVMGLGLFVAFVQAFIFSFLTIIYIGQALEDAHH
jgi:F-type H+-transporting ATPase subunit a